MPSHPVNPVAMAFQILEEYQQSVRDILEVAGCPDELNRKILKDLYITDVVYLSLNRSYKRSTESFEVFCSRYNLHTALLQQEQGMFPQFGKTNLYEHQVKAIESILGGRTTIISTGTGSGKTESFLIPLLDYCLKNRENGIKAIILYPMNALAGDQLRRIDDAVKSHPITVGCFIG
jgi:superfamily II DNA/RNA helicase